MGSVMQRPDLLSVGARIELQQEAVAMCRKAELLGAEHGVPCFYLLSKCDLLSKSNLPKELSPSQAKHQLESQIRNPSTENQSILPLSLVESESNLTSVKGAIMRKAFPEDVSDDEDVSLSEAVYLTFYCYSEADVSVLSLHGALPMLRVQKETLDLNNHAWLQQLPVPIPNPKKASPAQAKRLGKNHVVKLRANFWLALERLSDLLGGYQPDNLGSLHAVPFLVCKDQGALLIVLCQQLPCTPTSGSFGRRVVFKKLAQVAARMASAAPAIERYKFSGFGSYHADLKDVLLKSHPRELDPIKWLGRLRDTYALGEGAPMQLLTPGTYVCAMYVLSSLHGFQVLLHDQNHSMPPCVKISKSYLSAADWQQLQSFGRGVQAGVSPACHDNWAAAKSWMGPDISDESPFSAIQKFFYGVVALRQRLGRQCSAMHDELRFSRASRAPDCLSSLGTLFASELITLGSMGEIQMIMVTHFYNLAADDVLPPNMHWYPLSLFEARHYRRYTSEAFDLYCTGKHHQTVRVISKPPARNDCRRSSLKTSNLRDSSQGLEMALALEQHLAATANGNSASEAKNEAKLHGLLEKEAEKLENAWDPLRWTKRLLKAASTEDSIDEAKTSEASPKAQQLAYSHLHNSTVTKIKRMVKNIAQHADAIDILSVKA